MGGILSLQTVVESATSHRSHCAFFPDCRPCDQALLHELHGTIAHIYGDRIVYTRSIAGPWGREQLDHLMTLMGTLSGTLTSKSASYVLCSRPPQNTAGPTLDARESCSNSWPSTVRSLLLDLRSPTDLTLPAVQRLVLNHGQPNVRFQANKSQYSPEELPSSWTFRIARALLFYVHDVYIRDLDDLGRDSPLQNHEWMAFMEKAMTEWQEITLYVSVVAFLSAVPRTPRIGNWVILLTLGNLEHGSPECEHRPTNHPDRRY